MKTFFKFALSLTFIFSLILSSSNSANAAGWNLAGSNSFTGGVGVAMPITDLQVTDGDGSNVPVKLFVSSGTLAMSTTTGLTFTGPSTGSTLYFTGTLANVNNALATLTYTRGSAGSDTLEVSLVNPGEVFFADNGHLYEYISSLTTWEQARDQAALLTRYGATGYLTTITSQNENDFVAARLLNAGWMGASDSAQEDRWIWATGPETGTYFWQGLSNGTVQTYANWGTGEPNNSGNEDCGQFLAGSSGKWNDLPCSGFTLPGYVVEFGSSGNMPSVTSKNISITTLNAPVVSTLTPTDNATNRTVDTNLTLVFSSSVFVDSGNITIKKTIDDSTVEAIDVTGPNVSGSGTNTIVVNPTDDLEESTSYYILIGNTAFKNISDVYYAGISGITTWNFTTGDFTPPVVSSVSSSVDNNSYKEGEVIDIDVTFSEAVTSTGNVTVTLETGDVDRTCTFAITNSTTGTCNYTVQAGDNSEDLSATISGVIRDQATNLMVDFSPVSGLASLKNIVIDTTAPVLVQSAQVQNNLVNVTSATYSFTASETGEYTIESCGHGSSTTVNTGVSVNLYNLQNNKTYSCVFYLTDLAGNVSNNLQIGPFSISSPGSVSVAFLQMISNNLNAKNNTVNNIVLNTNTVKEIPTPNNIISETKSENSIPLFLINMKQGSRISDVRRLQEFLANQGGDIYPEKRITGYFGPLTHNAVVRFQEKYQDQVLSYLGTTKGTGWVYEKTRAKINEMLLNNI
ncbi:MAG: Ig-like domain-containing protein [Candidatus Paceibacterota bacterium]